MEVTNLMTMQYASYDTESLAFWQQHSRQTCSISTCRSNVLNNWSHSEWQAI